MIKRKTIKYLIFFFTIILGGKIGYKVLSAFGIVRILLFIFATFIILEIIYKIDKYFTNKH